METKYKEVTENTNEAILILQDGYIKYINQQAETYIGYSKSEFMEKSILDFIHPEDQDMVMEKYILRMKDKYVQIRYTFRFLNRDAKIRWVDVNSILITWEGRPAVMNFISDITDLIDAKKKLKDNFTFLKNMMDTIPLPIFYKNLDRRFKGCNKAFEVCSALREDMIIGKLSSPISPKEDSEMDKRLLDSGGIQSYETVLSYPNLGMRNVLFNKAIYRDSEGKVAGIVGVIIDITDRKKDEENLKKKQDYLEEVVKDRTNELEKLNAHLLEDVIKIKYTESALRASEAKLRKLFDNANDAIFLTKVIEENSSTNLIDANFMACELLGYSYDELTKMKFSDIVSPLDYSVLENMRDRFSHKNHFKFEVNFVTKSAFEVPVEVSSHLFYLNNMKVIISTARDITESKIASEKLILYQN